jgi:hypothetical protein
MFLPTFVYSSLWLSSVFSLASSTGYLINARLFFHLPLVLQIHQIFYQSSIDNWLFDNDPVKQLMKHIWTVTNIISMWDLNLSWTTINFEFLLTVFMFLQSGFRNVQQNTFLAIFPNATNRPVWIDHPYSITIFLRSVQINVWILNEECSWKSTGVRFYWNFTNCFHF